MIVAELLRLCGHGEHDDAGYIDPKLRNSPIGRDCLKTAGDLLQSRDWANAATLAVWRSEAALKIEQTVAQVQREPGPDPFKENWCALSSLHLGEGQED